MHPLSQDACARTAGLEAVPGDELDALYRAYAPYVAGIALKLLGRDSEIEDVVQNVFLQAIDGLRNLRNRDAIKGWLATVAVRIAGRRLRLRRVRGFLHVDLASHGDLPAPGATPEQHALLVRIYQILDELPVQQRIAWTLRNLEGEQLHAVAAMCRCSLATAKRRIAAAQERIEQEVSDD
jgi:RNA polymerase sigma-70 factor (ECF subfamily)